MKRRYDHTPREEGVTWGWIKQRIMALIVAVTVIAAQSVMAQSPEPVPLGGNSIVAVLAGASITSTGSGMVDGDVDLSPGSSQGIPPAQINGTVHVNDAVAIQAQVDLTDSYTNAQGRTLGAIPVSGNIGAQTLVPGLYSSGTSLMITGDLILDGGGDPNAVWIFQMGTSLTTADGPGASRVILTNSAQARNVFWQVGTSATLGTDSIFVGTILAQSSITMKVGAVADGRLLARTGTVDFSGGGLSVPADIQVSIISPPNGFTYVTSSCVTIDVSAVASNYGVSRVEVMAVGYLGTNWLGADTTAPYQFVWCPSLAGEYLLTAFAWDGNSNMASSVPVLINGTAPIWTNAVDLGGGWRWTPWFGYFEEDGNTWIWHNEHGWMAVFGDTTADIWFYTVDLGWLWSSETTYPYIYRFSDGAWLWYQVGSVSPRWFYNFTTALWEAW